MTTPDAPFSREVGAGLRHDELPAYAPMLEAFHRACEPSLRAIIAEFPLRATDRVLDLACGDGFHSVWLAERVTHGKVMGADLSPAFLSRARTLVDERGMSDRVQLVEADVRALPFDDDTFDAVWCAHSLYSLPDPIEALREMRRVVRPGGCVGIVENDSLHHMLLPWPAALELTVRRAQMAAVESEHRGGKRFYIGRYLASALTNAGLHVTRVKTHSIDHRAPYTIDEKVYLAHYLGDLADRAKPYLTKSEHDAVLAWLDPGAMAERWLSPEFFASHLEIVAHATK